MHPEYAGIAWTCSGDPCIERGFIEFDLSSIHAGSVINAAHLNLYANPNPLNGNGLAMQGSNESWIERITSPWNESTINWSNAPGSTQLHRVQLPASTGSFQDYTADVRDLVQDMVDDPANSHGFLLRLDNESFYTSMIFASSDYPDSVYWPMLEVTYTPVSGQRCQTVLVTDGNGQDAAVTSFAPTTPYPNHEEFGGIAWTCNGDPCWQHGLMQFDLSFIPSNAIVDSAFLELHADPAAQVTPPMQGYNACWIRRVTSGWNAASVTWNSEPGTTNQNKVYLPQSTGGYQDYLHWDVLPLVRDMVANPASSFGFEIELENPVYYSSMVFASSDYPDPSLHPSLKVCYRLATATDELSGIIGGIEVYPNPVQERLNVIVRLTAASNLRFVLTDIQGRVIHQDSREYLSAGDHTIQLSLSASDLTSGIYFLRLISSDGSVCRKVQVVH